MVRNVRAMARLPQLNERTSRLVASVTHDYRTPLAVIAGLAELLLAADQDAPVRRDLLEVIQKEALRLNEMVVAMLDLSCLSLGGQPLQRAPLDLAALVEECVARSRGAVAATGPPGAPGTGSEGGPAPRATPSACSARRTCPRSGPTGGDQSCWATCWTTR